MLPRSLHRPSNVDREDALGPLLDVLREVSDRLPLLLALHPRTRANIERFGLEPRLSGKRMAVLPAQAAAVPVTTGPSAAREDRGEIPRVDGPEPGAKALALFKAPCLWRSAALDERHDPLDQLALCIRAQRAPSGYLAQIHVEQVIGRHSFILKWHDHSCTCGNGTYT